jgi:uncharacterized membrane protein YjgN (DUF898 family)
MEANTHKVSFTGSGSEYFRIWIVNLLLTVLTLGIYSAWAKVRRQQYFDRNTQLAGVCFDYHANPLSILAGRMIAVALLLGYQIGVGASVNSALLVIAVVIVSGPFLLQRALAFRLRNTSYRGVRFDFNGSVTEAYAAYMPTIFILLWPTLLTKVQARPRWMVLSVMMFLLWPLAHSAIRHFQHSNLAFGDKPAEYTGSTSGFYKAYGWAAAAAIAGIGIAILIAVGLTFGLKELFDTGLQGSLYKTFIVAGAALVSAYVVYLFAYPFLTVYVGNYVWNNTMFAGVSFRSKVPAWGFIKLQTRNVFLTLLTLGLYRPFAVVNTYAYRLAHTELETETAFDNVVAGYSSNRGNASGDGAADMFGFDLSW